MSWFSGLKSKIIRKFQGCSTNPLFYLGGLVMVFAVFFSVSQGKNKTACFPTVSYAQESASHSFTLGPNLGIIQAPDFYLVQKNSLKSVCSTEVIKTQALASLLGSDDQTIGTNNREIIEYTVQPGDTVWSIANQFQITPETIFWANNLSKNASLSVGKKLVILPVSGVMHMITTGETLGAVVKKCKGDLAETIAFNNLEDENEVFIGDIIIIPGGTVPAPVVIKPLPTLAPTISGYFICPIASPCRLTQGRHWYNAVDISHGVCWEPIFAAASGTVQKVKVINSASRWALGGSGSYLTILHNNGMVTYYGHMASIIVSSGQQVSQGQVIGYMGGGYGMAGSGNSTGCHVHFEVIGGINPFARY